jgi:MoxR-like ATPase
MNPVQEFAAKVTANVEKVIIGKGDTIELLLVAMLCEGHVLLEDVPGVGKTMLARSLALSIGGAFKRLQCTPDLLPNDVTGVSVFNQQTSQFEFRPGPIFVNILLADEINRATPRTQSALLEAMQEQQVTVDGVTRLLPRPFLVMATQNPIEYEGIFPLPEAQLDRFLMRVAIGYHAT